jgi:very-short-patch-repair endonuclease
VGKAAKFRGLQLPMSCPAVADLIARRFTIVTPHTAAAVVNKQRATSSSSPTPPGSGAKPPPLPGAAAPRPPANEDQGSMLRRRAVNLFTFLREMVSLRSTVVRNCESYDRVLWLDQVPREAECDCVAFHNAKGDEEAEEWWLRVRKPVFSEPPQLPPKLVRWVNPEHLKDSSLEAPPLSFEKSRKAPVKPFDVRPPEPGTPQPKSATHNVIQQFADLAEDELDAAPEPQTPTKTPTSEDQAELRNELQRYLNEKWKPWAQEDRRKRRVLGIYTDLFSLYQQQKELGEAYEVVLAIGQLRWIPKPGVEVNRHLVAVQTSIEFDATRGVIRVGPAAEGAKPRLEEDMLLLDERPGPEVLVALEQQVAACDDDVWHNDQMVNALKTFVHSLGNGNGTYREDLAPVERATEVPQVRWAPAVIVRHRTEQGLLQVYGRILEDLKKRPDIPQGLIPLVEIGAYAREAEQGKSKPNQTVSDEDLTKNLLFPLHFNDEQKEIVRRIDRQSGVVVQGPPGTGKSHTIANLVCHLLATGNRVLVTSHAPRALRILKDKIPPAITNMCVVLLGNDRTALTELEQSVQVITEQLNTWDPRTREATVKDLEQQLATLRSRAGDVDKSLRAIRESDTFKHPETPGGYSGTLQKIGQTLRAQQPRYGWIAQFTAGADLDKMPEDAGITNDEATQLLAALRSLDADRRKELNKELLPTDKVVAPSEFEKMLTDEKHHATVAEQARLALEPPEVAVPPTLPLPRDLDADLAVLVELSELMDKILRHNSELESHRFTWGPRLARDVRALQYEHWKLLLEQTIPKLEAIKKEPEHVYELEVIHIGEREIATFRDDVEALCKHVEAGGKLKSFMRFTPPTKELKYILASVEIGGKRIKDAETLKQLRAWAEVQFQLKSLEQLWSDVSEVPLGAILRRMPVWYERCNLIETAQQMHQFIERARELIGKLPIVKNPAWDDTDELKLLSRQLKVLVAQKEHANRRKAVVALSERAFRFAANSAAHQVAAKLGTAAQKRDLEAYRTAHGILTDLWAAREKWKRSEELLKKLAQRLPKAASALYDDPAEVAWDQRLGVLNQSWLWLRADRWLKQQLDPRHFEYLQTERKGLQDHIQQAMVKIAAEKSWHHCMARMTPTEETYLKAWMQAIRNIGAGTGKRATRFRRVARQTLDKCRSAIPAWIMPIHRLAETVSPGEDLFDVVIVDEASQSGAEALFLQYIARKIIIVGDDKQIAPYNVGISRDDVELLRSRHISDLPLSDYFDLEHSFFDQAYLRFGNRIRLCEHFRCMPEIIQFSNNLCYNNEPLIPLRQYGDGRIEPVVVARHVPNASMEGTSPTVVNRAEADAIVRQIGKLVADPSYKDKTFGVISLLGEKQARFIEQKLLAEIGPEEMERRRLIVGDAYSFQGDERHVMFLSLVVAGGDERRFATLTTAADERRFNVAASRARDQMWLFHSVMPNDLSQKCLRRMLLEYCLNPHVPEEKDDGVDIAEVEGLATSADRSRVPAPQPFESWLEVDVYLEIRRRGYRVLAQRLFAGYKIDMVVNGAHGRLGIECDGEEWAGQDHYDADMGRQRQLERCGWRFWRIRGGTFYRNPEAAMQPLWELLEKQGIRSRTSNGETAAGKTNGHKTVAAANGDDEPAQSSKAAKKPAKRQSGEAVTIPVKSGPTRRAS